MAGASRGMTGKFHLSEFRCVAHSGSRTLGDQKKSTPNNPAGMAKHNAQMRSPETGTSIIGGATKRLTTRPNKKPTRKRRRRPLSNEAQCGMCFGGKSAAGGESSSMLLEPFDDSLGIARIWIESGFVIGP